MTLEGYFSDPAYGGNRDMIGWRMVGFPGAYAQYVELVDVHDLAYSRAPISIAVSCMNPSPCPLDAYSGSIVQKSDHSRLADCTSWIGLPYCSLDRLAARTCAVQPFTRYISRRLLLGSPSSQRSRSAAKSVKSNSPFAALELLGTGGRCGDLEAADRRPRLAVRRVVRVVRLRAPLGERAEQAARARLEDEARRVVGGAARVLERTLVEHDDVGQVGTTRTHIRESLVAGSIEERYRGAIHRDGVGADMLGDSARFAACHVGIANRIEEGSFPVVDVSHDRDHRRAGLKLGRVIVDGESRRFLEQWRPW